MKDQSGSQLVEARARSFLLYPSSIKSLIEGFSSPGWAAGASLEPKWPQHVSPAIACKSSTVRSHVFFIGHIT